MKFNNNKFLSNKQEIFYLIININIKYKIFIFKNKINK